MKHFLLKTLTASAFAFCLLTSCDSGMYTVGAQLNEPVYVRPSAPGPDYVWISGDWVRGGSGYTWKEGYWSRPQRNRVWVSGNWQQRNGGYHWRPGHWRR